MIRIGVLGSTRGTLLPFLAEGLKQNRVANIEVVITNKQDALILERARVLNISHYFLDPINLSREAYDKKLSACLHDHAVDLIVLLGYMRILSPSFVAEWENKIINIHPSLLPAFAGKMDLAVHQAVIEAGVKETGCTVHVVTQAVDEGPIILQRKCVVLATDTPQSLKERVQQLEGEALLAAISERAFKIKA